MKHINGEHRNNYLSRISSIAKRLERRKLAVRFITVFWNCELLAHKFLRAQNFVFVHFVIRFTFELWSPVLNGAAKIFYDRNFHEFCITHEDHKNLYPRKFATIQYLQLHLLQNKIPGQHLTIIPKHCSILFYLFSCFQ